jgi:hypothetical protein
MIIISAPRILSMAENACINRRFAMMEILTHTIIVLKEFATIQRRVAMMEIPVPSILSMAAHACICP